MKRRSNNEGWISKKPKIIIEPSLIGGPIPQLIPDVITYMLTFVSSDNIRYYRLVCKLWNKIIKNITDKIIIFVNQDILKTSKIFPNIKDLTIRNKHFSIINIPSVWIPKVKNLTLLNNGKPFDGLSHLTELEELTLSTVDDLTATICLEKVFHEMTYLKNLKKLNLYWKIGYCRNCSPLYGNLINIEEINIDYGKEFSYNIIKYLSTLPNLKKLSLYSTSFINFNPANFDDLGFTALEELDVRDIMISDISDKFYYARWISEMKKRSNLICLDNKPIPTITIDDILNSDIDIDT